MSLETAYIRITICFSLPVPRCPTNKLKKIWLSYRNGPTKRGLYVSPSERQMLLYGIPKQVQSCTEVLTI